MNPPSVNYGKLRSVMHQLRCGEVSEKKNGFVIMAKCISLWRSVF